MKTIATDLEGCPSYPSKVVVPVVISDLDLMRGVEFYRYISVLSCMSVIVSMFVGVHDSATVIKLVELIYSSLFREKRFPAACWRHKNGAVLLRGGTASYRRYQGIISCLVVSLSFIGEHKITLTLSLMRHSLRQ